MTDPTKANIQINIYLISLVCIFILLDTCSFADKKIITQIIL